MTAIQVIALLAIVVSAATVISYLLQAGKDIDNEPVQDFPFGEYTKEELENIKLAEELYNKDLRSQEAKAALDLEVDQPEFISKDEQALKVFPPEATIHTPIAVKSEFPIDKPKKKRKSNNKNKK